MSINKQINILSNQVQQLSTITGKIANSLTGLSLFDKMTKEPEPLQPECYKRHAEIENHITEGRGWRGVMITVVITLIVQVCSFLIMWGSLTKTVEVNTKRITDLEIIHPRGDNGKMISMLPGVLNAGRTTQ
jgi:hypothetical protein